MMRHQGTIAAAAAFAVVFFASAAKSNATVELCPASLERLTANAPGAPSATFTYELQAASVRKIEHGTLIADTDRGWFRWSVDDVTMAAATEKTTTRFGSYAVKIARSARLDVGFPAALTVHRAWVERAQASGVPVWSDKGDVPCQVPAFASRDADADELARDQMVQILPENPSAGTPPAKAVAAATPFATIDCAVPFQVAKVTDTSVPQFPDAARELVLYQTSAEIVVSLDEAGRLMDASVYASSGNGPIDESALRAARKSSYAGGVSYCQSVRGQYLFTATFRP
jgi:TonB family protein